MEGDAVFVGCYERFVFKYIINSVPQEQGSHSEATESVQRRRSFRTIASHAAHTVNHPHRKIPLCQRRSSDLRVLSNASPLEETPCSQVASATSSVSIMQRSETSMFTNILRIDCSLFGQSGLDEDSLTVPDAGGISYLAAFTQSTDGTASLLLSGCTDGSIHIWKRKGRSWQHHKRLPFHKAAVNAIDIHSTGRMAFTVGRSAPDLCLSLHLEK